MKTDTRREFLEAALALGAAGFFLAGCKTMETVSQVLPSEAQSLIKVGTAVAKTFEDFTPEQEYYIGRTIGATVLDKYPAYDEGPANAYLNLVGQTLAAASDRPDTFGGYRFQIQDSDEINAFAAPGGFIFVTKGLIRCCKDEDALAAVLAHEIGHVQAQHGLQAIKNSRVTDAITTIGIEGAKQFGSAELSSLTDIFSDSISDIANTMIVSGYSRTQEKEADLAAATLLKRVGYNPQGLINMLDRMEGLIKPDALDFAKTHPSPKDRIAALEPTLGAYTPYSLPKKRMMRFMNQIAWV